MSWIWRNSIISTPVSVAVYLFIYFSETGLFPDLNTQWQGIILAVALTNLWGGCLYLLNPHFNRLAPWNKNISFRFIIELAAGFIVLGLFSLVFIYAYLKHVQSYEENSFWNINREGVIKFGIISMALIYIYSLVKFSLYSFNQYTTGQIETLSAERRQLRFRFEALKSQRSPHYLFNALNTISSLIYKNSEMAEDFIRQLAFTYRYILKTDNVRLISLEKELNMVRAYFFMQKIRFEGCIDLNIDIKPVLYNTFVPPLALQLLVENALKHNTISEEKPLSIDIYDEGEKHLVVRNNIISKPELLKIGNNLFDRPTEPDSFNIGLSNIRKRYLFFTNDKIEIKADRHYNVTLPVILSNNEE